MSRRKLIISIIFIVVAVLSAFGSGVQDDTVADTAGDPLSEGIGMYNKGNLAEAESAFRQAAASNNPETAAAAYYNQGTVQAELAKEVQEPEKKRALLEESFQSLKRAAELGKLPANQQKNARRNMEIVREQISQLPPPPPEGEEGQQDPQQGQPQDQQSGQSQDGQSGQPQDGQGGQAEQGGQSPEELLSQQRDLSKRTKEGEGSNQELAEEQKQLQKASEEAGMNEAAVNQAKAAKALNQGERDEAGKYQKAAEQALAEAASKGEDGEAEEILNQEAENDEQRNRLDKMGGITDAQRNW